MNAAEIIALAVLALNLAVVAVLVAPTYWRSLVARFTRLARNRHARGFPRSRW